MQDNTQDTTMDVTPEITPTESPETYTDPYQQTEEMNEAVLQVTEIPKSDIVPGIIGALLGSLIGCALWVLIYRLGYIAGLAGAVTGICAMKGYEKLGKCLDRKGVISCVVIMIIMIFLANKLAWSWEIYDVYTTDFGYEMTFFDAFLSSDEIIGYSELTMNYYGDLGIGYLLTALSSFKDIKNAFKAGK